VLKFVDAAVTFAHLSINLSDKTLIVLIHAVIDVSLAVALGVTQEDIIRTVKCEVKGKPTENPTFYS
jgi:uncharacterized protein YabE (DUF348 family)